MLDTVQETMFCTVNSTEYTAESVSSVSSTCCQAALHNTVLTLTQLELGV